MPRLIAGPRMPIRQLGRIKNTTREIKGRKPRIPGTRAINIVEKNGYRVYNDSSFKDSLSSSGTTSSSGFRLLGDSTRVGTVNPAWKDDCRLGVNATTQMSFADSGDSDRSFWSGYSVGTSFLQSNNAVRRVWSYGSSSFLDYGIMTAGVAPSPVIADVHNRCVRKFIDSVTAAQSSENLTGRSIKHFKHDVHSTLHPMAGIQSKISSYLTSLEKVKYGKLKGPSLYNTITQAYLEFKFGVEPFVQDITDITVDMCIRDRKRNPTEPVRGSAHQAYAGSATYALVSSYTGYMSVFQPFQHARITSVYSERIKGAVRTGINDDGKLGFVQDNRLLPKDWLPTIFSIMPYAWMVNYFTNIRDIIDAAAFRFSDCVWGCSTTRDETTWSFSDLEFTHPNIDAGVLGTYQNFSTESTGGNATFSRKSGQRFILTPAQLVPSFAFSIPVTPTPWVNMMAAFSPRILSIGRMLLGRA